MIMAIQALVKLIMTMDPIGKINAYVDHQNAGVTLVDCVGSRTDSYGAKKQNPG